MPATFSFALLNTSREKAFVVDVNEKKMFGHSSGNSKENTQNSTYLCIENNIVGEAKLFRITSKADEKI